MNDGEASGCVDVSEVVVTPSRGGFEGCVGMDVKPMRTTRAADQTKHLANSREMFLRLLDVARSVDDKKIEGFRGERDYEGLERYVLASLMGA